MKNSHHIRQALQHEIKEIEESITLLKKYPPAKIKACGTSGNYHVTEAELIIYSESSRKLSYEEAQTRSFEALSNRVTNGTAKRTRTKCLDQANNRLRTARHALENLNTRKAA